MKLADLSLFVVRSNHTSISYMSQPDLIKDEFNLKNMKIVLNDANKASNYSGNFIGKRFRYSKNSKNTLITLIHKILKPVKK